MLSALKAPIACDATSYEPIWLILMLGFVSRIPLPLLGNIVLLPLPPLTLVAEPGVVVTFFFGPPAPDVSIDLRFVTLPFTSAVSSEAAFLSDPDGYTWYRTGRGFSAIAAFPSGVRTTTSRLYW